ncbi:hypothetical protein [Bacillus pumilus]|uniref:hypothetical protein n=1 Tax=Bacillus pumilus TaxID=1408 RepID=UPI00119E30D1|nr:hypothetical protein [Bacillus pumilus]
MFLELTSKEKRDLKYEIISPETRKVFTRYLRNEIYDEEGLIKVIKLNRIINMSHNVLNKPIYVYDTIEDLESDDVGWHLSCLELIFKVCNTIQFVEIILDLISNDLIKCNVVNKILKDHSVSFRVIVQDEVGIEIINFTEDDQFENSSEHVNIRSGIIRMNLLLGENDYTGVLAASANILETLAKDVLKNPVIDDKSFGSFFDSYKKNSTLPPEFIDYIHSIYKRRNSEPLSGHGSTKTPTITEREAIVISELTKMFVLTENKLMTLQ